MQKKTIQIRPKTEYFVSLRTRKRSSISMQSIYRDHENHNLITC